MIALAKAKPGTLSFASVGNGSPGHLAGELLDAAHRHAAHAHPVPRRRPGRDRRDGRPGAAAVGVDPGGRAVRQDRQAEGAGGVDRRSAAPPSPTCRRCRRPGVADFEVDSWYAMFVPAKTPRAVIERLNKALNAVVADPEVRATSCWRRAPKAWAARPRRWARPWRPSCRSGRSWPKDANIKAD